MPESTCSVEECARPVLARGWCRAHYYQWRKDTCLPCTVDGCTKPGTSVGMCQMHYARQRKHGDPQVVLTRWGSYDRRCEVDGCDEKHWGCGLCKTHYRQQPDQREHGKTYDRKRRESDPSRQAAEQQRGRERRDYIRAWNRQRVANMVIVETVVSSRVFARDSYRCQLCKKKTRGAYPEPTCPTLDHIIPVSLGGEHSYRNVQTACLRCNLSKGNRAANDQLLLIG